MKLTNIFFQTIIRCRLFFFLMVLLFQPTKITGNELRTSIRYISDKSKARVLLKKKKPLKEQLTNKNTIYVIKHRIILECDLDIPDGCILYFDGGSIRGNYTISGRSYCIIGSGKSNICVRRINSSGNFKCYNCKFIYLKSDSPYFIDCRGSCEIQRNEFIGFKSNVINLEKCCGECIVADNYIHDTDLLDAIDNERRAIHILHCGNVVINNNVIDKYIGCGIGFITSDDTADLYKSVVVSNNIIKNTRLGGITSMGNSAGNLYGAVIKGNKLFNINNSELNDFSALCAVINIHGGVNCVLEDNIIIDCMGLGLDIEGYKRTNNSYLIRNNIINGCRRLNFNLCDDIEFIGNKVSNIISDADKPGAIRIRKTLRFTMIGNDIDDAGAEVPTIQFEKNVERPSEKVKTHFICKNNRINVGKRVNSIYDMNCEMIVEGNVILLNGVYDNGLWQKDTKYPNNDEQ